MPKVGCIPEVSPYTYGGREVAHISHQQPEGYRWEVSWRVARFRRDTFTMVSPSTHRSRSVCLDPCMLPLCGKSSYLTSLSEPCIQRASKYTTLPFCAGRNLCIAFAWWPPASYLVWPTLQARGTCRSTTSQSFPVSHATYNRRFSHRVSHGASTISFGPAHEGGVDENVSCVFYASLSARQAGLFLS